METVVREAVDSSWQELQELSTKVRFNFGAPKLLESELTLIAVRIEGARESCDIDKLEACLADTQTLLKRLKSLQQRSQLNC